MIALVVLHLVVAAAAPLLTRWIGRRAFWVLALPPAVTAGWALASTSTAMSDAPPVQRYTWAESLNLELAFRLDPLAWLMTLVVSVVGALVLVYCSGYFDDDHPGLGRFAGSLTAFAGAMLGLVTSDDVLVLYVFWEATTVLSYLLIGHTHELKSSRSAASQALIVTTFGGLAMLIGLLMVAEGAGTYRLSEIVADPPTGSVTTVGIVLVLLGALTKSALIPFHFWLPGAMAAPTPVSAYLHAAAMVKAGIYLVARLAPAFSGVPAWRWVVLVAGGGTMILGGYRALRQFDLKLLLAFGTVSQLGFLTVLLGLGHADIALAGVALLLAHALFKSSLFLAVGAIDHATGTRDIRQLWGLRRSMPVVYWTCVLALASMAGLPPLLGFVGKEAVYGALLHGGPTPGDLTSTVMLVVVVVGSVLTIAYSGRFLFVGLGEAALGFPYASSPVHPTTVRPIPRVTVAVPLVLALAGLVLAPFTPALEPWLAKASGTWPKTPDPVHLGLWHGFNEALLLSAITVALGVLMIVLRSGVAMAQTMLIPTMPAAERVYRWVMRQIEKASVEVTGFLQRGSLELNLGAIFLVLVLLPGSSLLLGVTWPDEVTPFDNPAQVPIAVIMAVAAIAATRSRRRLRGVFLVGITGYCAAMLFLLHGAPDLALTQLLVETVSIVVFMLVLRRLPSKFYDDSTRRNRRVRLALGAAVGVVMTGLALTAAAVRTHEPSSTGMAESAKSYGGGDNIVNVILVDIRAWDTMGELSVVLVAATGVASLVFLRTERATTSWERVRAALGQRRTHARASQNWARWIPAASALPHERRSLMLEVATRLIFHTVMAWSLYLLFSGHNNPGGGFAAGLVAGLGLVVRYLAGGREEMRAALPVVPGALLGAGLFLSAGTGLVSMLVGGDVLQTWIYDLHLPLLGDIHLVTSVFFDVGVYLVVIGLMLDILSSLGAALDKDIETEGGRSR